MIKFNLKPKIPKRSLFRKRKRQQVMQLLEIAEVLAAGQTAATTVEAAKRTEITKITAHNQ